MLKKLNLKFQSGHAHGVHPNEGNKALSLKGCKINDKPYNFMTLKICPKVCIEFFIPTIHYLMVKNYMIDLKQQQEKNVYKYACEA